MGREIETYLNETIPVNALNRIKEKVLTITDVREVMRGPKILRIKLPISWIR